jgi:hypothetical protein
VDSIANHIATVEDYLAKYRLMPAQKQLGYQSYFAKYLVAQCWNKMRRRITDWSSQGFIWQLARISETQLQDAFSQYATEPVLSQSTAKRYNFALGALVVGMEDAGQIESVIMKPCGRPEFHSERLTNLVAAFRETRVLGPSQPRDDGLGEYGKSTCVEFHRLFVATLLSYGRHLEALQHTDEMNGMDRAQKYEQVWICGFLLWRIVSSRMFQHHSRVLRKSAFLTLPINDNEEIVRHNNYTGFATRGCQDIAKAEPGCDTSETVAQEYQRTFKGSSSYMEKVTDAFVKWARLQVSHLSALDALSSTFCSPSTPPPPKVALLAVKCPHFERELQVEPWRNTLRDLLASTSGAKHLNADSVIMTISHHIDMTKNKVNTNPIFKIFGTATDRITFKGSTHCETLLTSLIKYAEDAPMANNDFLRALLQVMLSLLNQDPYPSDAKHRMQTMALLRRQTYAARLVGSSWIS